MLTRFIEKMIFSSAMLSVVFAKISFFPETGDFAGARFFSYL